MKLNCDVEVYIHSFVVMHNITEFFPKKSIGDVLFSVIEVEVFR